MAIETTAPDTTDREAARCTTYVTPLLPVRARRVWTWDSYALPIPRLARRLVRDGRQWREIVHAAVNRYQYPQMSGREQYERAEEYRALMRTLIYLGPDSDAFARLVLRLFPIARCAWRGCREPYIRYDQRVTLCSDRCRREMDLWKRREGERVDAV